MPKSIEDQLKEAQAESTRLTEENTALKATADTHAAELETAKAEIPEATQEQLATLTAKAEELQASLTAAEARESETAKLLESIGIKADADTKDNTAALKSHIENQASAKAAAIVAQQGADDPLPVDAQKGGKPEASANLSGLDLATEAISKQFANLNLK